VLVRVLLKPRVVGLVEDRQADLAEVDQLDVEAAVPLGQLLQPGSDRTAPPPGTGYWRRRPPSTTVRQATPGGAFAAGAAGSAA
jgi:hypothetical protein